MQMEKHQPTINRYAEGVTPIAATPVVSNSRGSCRYKNHVKYRANAIPGPSLLFLSGQIWTDTISTITRSTPLRLRRQPSQSPSAKLLLLYDIVRTVSLRLRERKSRKDGFNGARADPFCGCERAYLEASTSKFSFKRYGLEPWSANQEGNVG